MPCCYYDGGIDRCRDWYLIRLRHWRRFPAHALADLDSRHRTVHRRRHQSCILFMLCTRCLIFTFPASSCRCARFFLVCACRMHHRTACLLCRCRRFRRLAAPTVRYSAACVRLQRAVFQAQIINASDLFCGSSDNSALLHAADSNAAPSCRSPDA